jgi:hypothetical protein
VSPPADDTKSDGPARMLARSGRAADHDFDHRPVGASIQKCPKADDDWALVLLHVSSSDEPSGAGDGDGKGVEERPSGDDDWTLVDLEVHSAEEDAT